mgnify:FL=1
MNLYQKILALRSRIVNVAQREYDNWDQDDEGFDPEFGQGGICTDIANEIGQVLVEDGIDITSGGQEGMDHAWVVAYDKHTAYDVDIPCRIYEDGSGYTWMKLWGIKFTVNDVVISKINRSDLDV